MIAIIIVVVVFGLCTIAPLFVSDIPDDVLAKEKSFAIFIKI